MKNIIVLVFISFVAFSGFGQAPRSHEQITNDAYLDYVNKGYPPSQWPQYQSKYVEDYKNKKYNITNGGGEYQRKKTYVAGLIRNSAGQTIGNYSNGQVLNSNNQPIGYLNRGQFMSQQGAYSNCVGTIQGNKIMSCQGGIYYTINSSSILNSQGASVAFIRGESIYNSSNQLIATISGISYESVAAYLLFLAR